MKLPVITSDDIFHAYDVRGLCPAQLNEQVAYRLGHTFFALVPGERFVIGYDMRESSLALFHGFVRAANDLGKRVDSLGMVTTDTLYFALGKYGYDGGVMITASHNPKVYNGMKFMAKNVIPVDMTELKQKYAEIQVAVPEDLITKELVYQTQNYDKDYTDEVLSFVDPAKIGKFKIAIDAGNGMGGANMRKVFAALPQLEIIDMYFEPNSDFPHHESNPQIPENTKELSETIVHEKADFGISYDGDGDRCFFVDDKGGYVPGQLGVALVARIMLARHPGAIIAHEYKNIWAIQYEIKRGKGIELKVPTGHSFFKKMMHEAGALFGGESASHFYFKDAFYADNGVVPFLLVLQYLSEQHKKLSEVLEEYRQQFFSSGEMNFLMYEGVSFEQMSDQLEKRFPQGEHSHPDGLVVEAQDFRFNVRMSNTEPILRVNLETRSAILLKEKLQELRNLIEENAMFLGSRSSAGNVKEMQMTDQDKFNVLLSNLWYTWNPHYILPIIDLYGDGWRKNPPPKRFIEEFGSKKLSQILAEKSWEIGQNMRLMKDYLKVDDSSWFDKYLAVNGNKTLAALKEHPIAYFCLEYGLIDWLQIYSGGLGVLAADFIKQASDMGLPVVGVGIFYHEGYFHQDFDSDGRQLETYIHQDPADYPMEVVKDAEGNDIQVAVEILDHDVYVRAFKLVVGRVNLLLLDTNFDKNTRWEDRMITGHLYGGDQDTRIRQEIVLGMAGPKIVHALGIQPSLYHMNEGHSGFLVLEVARQNIEEHGMTFEQALGEVHKKLVFTNHTLKAAGNDLFPFVLIEKYLGSYTDNLQTNINSIYDLGRDDRSGAGGFSMTILGLRFAQISNAVSKLHGEAAKKIWPDYHLVPITNGVHMATWVAPEIHQLLDKYVGENWHFPETPTDFGKVQNIPQDLLWQAHMKRKHKLIHSINTELRLHLDPDALTIAWSRRLASYKRPDLIISDIERLKRIVGNDDRPVQILISGKAHPQDGAGKEILQRINANLSHIDFKSKVVILPGYNWQLARRMVSGADVWLNTPYRYEEASGTSGMKAAANGVIQFTTMDGWTDEVDWFKKGWVIAEDNPSKSLHDILEYQLIPLYFDRGPGGFNQHWTEMMLNSMQLVLEQFSTERMLTEYLEHIYLPMLQNVN